MPVKVISDARKVQCREGVKGIDVPGFSRLRYHEQNHQNVFDKGRRPNQDYVLEFGLPSTERHSVLQTLNDYNLNAFSLFGSEESLLQTLWSREFVLREPLQP
jgi:hypothetical protein